MSDKIYQLYTSNHCIACTKVIQEIELLNLSNLEIINTDKDSRQPPHNLLVYPALLKQQNLLAYGLDIIAYLKNIPFNKTLKNQVNYNSQHLSDNEVVSLSQQLLKNSHNPLSTSDIIEHLEQLTFDKLNKQLHTDRHKLAFWINTYNSFSKILLVVQPRVLENPFSRKLFFLKKQINIAGEKLSLDDIEHKMLRHSKLWWAAGYLSNPFPSSFEKSLRVSYLDPRIHFTLNCGAESCPAIRFYTPENIENELDQATQVFLKSTSKFNETKNTVIISKLFCWYKSDFGGETGIIQFLKSYKIVPEKSLPTIKYDAYNWIKSNSR